MKKPKMMKSQQKLRNEKFYLLKKYIAALSKNVSKIFDGLSLASSGWSSGCKISLSSEDTGLQSRKFCR